MIVGGPIAKEMYEETMQKVTDDNIDALVGLYKKNDGNGFKTLCDLLKISVACGRLIIGKYGSNYPYSLIPHIKSPAKTHPISRKHFLLFLFSLH